MKTQATQEIDEHLPDDLIGIALDADPFHIDSTTNDDVIDARSRYTRALRSYEALVDEADRVMDSYISRLLLAARTVDAFKVDYEAQCARQEQGL